MVNGNRIAGAVRIARKNCLLSGGDVVVYDEVLQATLRLCTGKPHVKGHAQVTELLDCLINRERFWGPLEGAPVSGVVISTFWR